jgi:hypothetical protein
MMVERVLVLEKAAVDLKNGFNFYEKQRPGLGEYFADSIIADIESLRLSAGIYAIHYGAHRMLAKRFPFAIYYNLKDGAAYVIAVLDVRRDPTWVHSRITHR